MTDSLPARAARLLAAAAVPAALIASGGCASEGSDDELDLVVRDLRPRTTSLDTGGGTDRPMRGYPQTMSGTTQADPIELADGVLVHSPLTEAQLREGADLQAAALASPNPADAASAVLDGLRSCMDSVGEGYGHRVIGYALVFEPDGTAVAVEPASIEDGGYDTFDDWAGFDLSLDCRRLYADDYLTWVNEHADLRSVTADPCASAPTAPEWTDDVLAAIFARDGTDLAVRCAANGSSYLVARL